MVLMALSRCVDIVWKDGVVTPYGCLASWSSSWYSYCWCSSHGDSSVDYAHLYR